MKTRVLLADDHAIFREALRTMLMTDPEVEVVAEVGDGGEVVARARQTKPDVVCMDIEMPGLNGIEATRRLIAALPGVKVIALTAHSDQRSVVEMLNAGAAGYVCKSGAADELLRALKSVRRNQTYIASEVSSVLVDVVRGNASVTPASLPRLTSREREVLQLLAEGSTTPQIAERLYLAPSTVDVHRRNIMKKLNIHNTAELTKYAIRAGLTSI